MPVVTKRDVMNYVNVFLITLSYIWEVAVPRGFTRHASRTVGFSGAKVAYVHVQGTTR